LEAKFDIHYDVHIN